jgi:hypothetical protein
MTARQDGFCDGLFNRQMASPKTWPDCQQYLKAFFEGKQYRKDWGLTIYLEGKENDTQGT